MAKNSRGAMIGGIILVALGLIFLAAQFLKINISSYLWPFFIIGFGAFFFVGMAAGGKAAGALAIPGSIISMVGLILLYQNTFDHYASWAYAWGLIIVAVGIGFIINGRWVDNDAIARGGKQLIGLGLILFLAFGTFFELIIGISGYRGTGSIIWPVVLIGLGIYFLFGKGFRFPKSSVPVPPLPPTPPEIGPETAKPLLLTTMFVES